MKDNSKSKNTRAKAEEIFKNLPINAASLDLSEASMRKLIHELEVHQIELVMINDELAVAHKKADDLATDKYAELYDFTPSGYYTLNRNGEILELNLSGASMLGKERMLLINSHFRFFISEDTKPIFNQFFDNIFNLKINQSCNVTVITKDNQTLHVYLTGKTSPDGEVCLITAVDINEYWLEHEKLKQSEDKYRMLIQSQSDGIGFVDENEIFIFANPAANRIFESDNLIGVSLYDFLSLSEIDNINKQTQNRRNGISNNYELQITTPKGNVKYLRISSEPKFNENAVFEGTYAVFSDITEKKNAELLRDQQFVFTKALNDIAQIIIRFDNSDVILENVNAIVGRTLQVDRTLIYEVSIENNQINGLCEWLRLVHPDIAPTKAVYPIDMFIKTLSEIERTKTYIQSQSNAVNKFFIEDGTAVVLHEQMHIKSLIWYPFSFYDKGFYMFTINQILESRIWTSEEIGFIASIANQVNLALIKIRLLNQQQNSQNELAISEERFRQVVEQSQEVVWEVDVEGLYTYVSPLSIQVYGYTPEQMIGVIHFYDLHPEDKREQTIDSAFKIFNKKESFTNFENEIVHSDGKNIIVLTNGIPMLNQNGDLVGYRGVDIDITKRVEAEKELLKFRTLSDQANYGVIISSLEGILIYVNDAFAKMVGWKASDLIGKHSSVVHSEEQSARVEEIIAMMKTKRGFDSEELYHTRKDGTSFPTQMSSKVIYDGNNKPQYLAVTVIDISDRKQSEAELLKIYKAVEQSPVMTVISDLDGNIEYSNQALTNITGYTKAELIGQHSKILGSGKITDAEYSELWKTISSGKDWQGEFHNKKKNGELYWSGALVSPIFDAKGKITHYLSVQEDITQRKKYENEILELNTNLEQKVEVRTLQLNEANQKLESDIIERILIEKDLRWNKSLLELMSNSSPLGFLVVDNRTDEILYFNHRFCKIWGIEQLEEQMQRGEFKNNDIIPYCLPVLADIPAFAESYKQLQFEHNRLVIEDEIAFTDNRTVRRFSTQIRGDNDEYFGRFYIFEDISERKHTEIALIESEQRFSLFMDYLPALVFIKDSDSKMIYANNAMDIGLGVSQWINKSLFDAFDHETAERIIADDKKTIQTGGSTLICVGTNLAHHRKKVKHF